VENFFINQYFDWNVRRYSLVDRALNRLFSKVGLPPRFHASFILDKVDDFVARSEKRPVSPLQSGKLSNIEKRMNLYHLVSQALAYGVEGDLVELGCNTGESSVLITKVMRFYKSNKKFSVYDSFEGLPSLNPVDGRAYQVGQLKTSEDVLRDNFRRLGLPLPEIHRGWFKDTLSCTLPDKICFAYLDGDLYESILISLEHVYGKLTKGAICLIDDYSDPSVNPIGWHKLPGVKKACDEFLSDKPEKMAPLYAGEYAHGFFRKA